MPGFAGKVFHNNANRPVVDVADNQVKGLGIFSSVSDRNALDPTIQTDGFLALTNDGGSYKAFVFTGSTWNNDSDWTEVGGDALPTGSNYSVLVRGGDNAVSFDTTPRISAVEVFNSAGASAPNVMFTRTGDDSGVAQATGNNDILGEFRFRGHDSGDVLREAGIIKFVQTSVAQSGHINTKVEIGVGNSNGVETALTINEEKVVSIAKQSTVPTAVEGGLYADTSDNLYFGIA
jgi:hypothetical protein